MIYGLVFFTSAAFLGYEITFTRVFSFAQWHNLSSVIITMALLGSGVSGTVIAVRREFIVRNYYRTLFALTLLFPLFTAGGFILSAMLPVNPYSISFSVIQVFYISIYFFLMGLPFFAGSAIVCVSFMKKPPSGAYAANLFGSGAGGALPLVLSYHMHPYGIMAVVILISFIPSFILILYFKKKSMWICISVLSAVIAASVFLSMRPDFRRVSEYKPVSGALNLPGAKIVSETYSPLSVIQVVEAEGLRSGSGLSLRSPYQVPEQRMIYFDGDSPSPVTPFSGNTDKIRYLTFLSSWLPYYLKKEDGPGRVLIIGPGGGESLLKALMAGFEPVDAVEMNSRVITLMKAENAEFSGNVYLDKRVALHNEDGRSFARRSRESYDLIDIPMIDAFNSAASGVYALNESYLYTVESFRDFYRRLTPRGILSVTRWITTPPRDILKIFSTAVTSLERMNVPDPGKHLLAVRSVQTMTLLVSASPFTDNDITRVKRFCDERLFDIVYCPGMKIDEADKNIRQDNALLYRSFTALLSARSREFIESHESDISAPDDNRPYFYNFFRPAFLKYIVQYGAAQVPVTEWGYLPLVIILIPVVIISFTCILFPLLKGRKRVVAANRWLLPYFAFIAAGYFFIEMPLIQKMILFLGSPVFSMGVIISALLVFSGIGSLFSDSILRRGRGMLKCSLVICIVTMFYTFSLDFLFSLLVYLPLYTRIAVVILLTALPAFFMGIPFPAGLSLLKKGEDSSLSFAWGVNGFFSVISIITASICAVVYGYRTVLIMAVIFYFTAGVVFPERIVDLNRRRNSLKNKT